MTVYVTLLGYLAVFLFIALAARQIGLAFRSVGLPLISGYLFAGMLAGPFIFDFVSSEASHALIFIDELSLAAIAFAAGGELYLKELRGRLRSIAWVTVGLVVATYVLTSGAVLLLSGHIPFMADMPLIGRVAIAILAGSIMVARSPSSAIAIVNELHAKGSFTKTALGVTVIMDVIVIIFFAFNSSLADALLTGTRPGLDFLGLLLLELVLSIGSGYVLGLLLQQVICTHLPFIMKTILILAAGFATFIISAEIRHWTHTHLSFELFLEPLLITMIASFYVTNFTDCRDELRAILHRAGPPIYVVFFTLTGASLALDVLLSLWPIALALFAVRLVGLFVGSFTGGVIAGDEMRCNRIAWMAYITQAGVGLGLAKEVAVEFPEFGPEFATVIISIIVLSQIIGPPFFKNAIKRMGESHLPGEIKRDDRQRDALILGIGDQSLALARQLQLHNWQIIMADTDQDHVYYLASENGSFPHHLTEITMPALRELVTGKTDALVAMLDDDDANYRACAIAYEMGVSRLIVRLNNLAYAERFAEFDALVVYPSSAMVLLLDHFVRSPRSTAMLFNGDPSHEMVQVTVSDADFDGIRLRDLLLPSDVLILNLVRHGRSIVPHGYTTLHVDDEITLVGSQDSLDEVTLRVGY